jgi:hypothetical protein
MPDNRLQPTLGWGSGHCCGLFRGKASEQFVLPLPAVAVVSPDTDERGLFGRDAREPTLWERNVLACRRRDGRVSPFFR